MNPAQLDDFKNVLLQELAAATESLGGNSGIKTSEQVFRIPDETDMANLSHNRTIINAMTEARLRRLRSIEQALRRIDRGEYGSCKRCEKDIQTKRLAAMPWVTHCLRCQSELEHAHDADDNVKRI